MFCYICYAKQCLVDPDTACNTYIILHSGYSACTDMYGQHSAENINEVYRCENNLCVLD